MINVQVEKGSNENSLSILRRFTKRVQGSGVLSRVRSIRYAGRNQSPLSVKRHAMNKLEKRAEVELAMKLGKFKQPERRGAKPAAR